MNTYSSQQKKDARLELQQLSIQFVKDTPASLSKDKLANGFSPFSCPYSSGG